MASNILTDLLFLPGLYPLIVHVITWVCLVCLLSTILLLTYTLLLRIYKDFRKRRYIRFKKKWRPVLFEWLDGNRIAIPHLGRTERRMMLALWFDTRRHLDHGSAKGLNLLAGKLELDRYATRTLDNRKINTHRRNVWQQILAVRVCMLMNTDISRQALLLASNSANFLVNIEATCALVELGDENAEYSVLSSLMQFNQWVPFIANKVSKSGGSDLLHLVISQIDTLNNEQSRNLLSLIEYSDDRSLIPLLTRHLEREDDPEVQALILKTLGRIGDIETRDSIIPFLNSPYSWLRVQAIHALEKTGDRYDLDLIRPLLSDKDWWVRYRAAQTCLAFIHNDSSRLVELQSSLQDPFARDILAQALAEESL